MASDKANQWLQLVLDGTDPKSATKEVFDCETGDSLRSKTGQLKRQFVTELHTAVMDNIKFLSPAILTIIKDIALDANDTGIPPAVRLKACSELLSRAGYDPSIEVNLTETLSAEQLQARIDLLIEEHPEIINQLTNQAKPTTH